ncbi:MAG: MotA/TolQ/ExbB proton channel family protein [Porphyromonadaceae bacterium]|nr:MotA/TolQ/ExbB proton channel family protein [Porphyromonadaceae bacterium]
METKQPKAKKAKKESKGFRGIESAFLVIVICFIIAECFYNFVLGDLSHFTDATRAEPKPGDLLGTIYKGGIIVPVLQTLLLTVITLSVERAIAISIAKGKGSLTKFVVNVKAALAANDLAKAQEYCDKQKGCVGSVVTSTLKKYAEMEGNDELTKEQKLASIQKEVEEATALELPTLEMNLAVVATMTTLGTLVGLLGTVLGMIRSFAALATATGAPDSVALSTGISEALVNTAFGIATGACAVISYNFFTSKIDKITYAIDEVGFSIVQSYATNHK